MTTAAIAASRMPMPVPMPVPVPVPASMPAPLPPERAKALEVAHQLETVFGQLFVKSLRQASFEDQGGGLFGNGPGSDQFTSWFDTMLAERMSDGRGLGIAETLMHDWEDRGQVPRAKPGTTTAAGAVRAMGAPATAGGIDAYA